MKHFIGLGIVVCMGAIGSLAAVVEASPVLATAHLAVDGPAGRPRVLNTKWIYVADVGTGNVTVWSPRGKLHKTFPVQGGANAVAVNRQRWVYALGDYSEINVFERGATLPFLQFYPPYECYSLDGLAAGYDGTLYVASQSCEGSSSFGGVWVFPPGKTTASAFLQGNDFENFFYVTSDLKHNIYATEDGYSSSNYADVREFTDGGKNSHLLGLSLYNPGGVDIASNGDIVVCSAAGVQTFPPGSHQASSVIAVPCGDISLADNNTAIYVTQGTVVTRYAYPSGTVEQTLSGFKDATGVAVQGAISD